jgi:hypothetical protein
MKTIHFAFVSILLATAGLACGHGRYLPGTTIAATDANRDILDTIETYRTKLMEKDIDGLLRLATILRGRLQRVESIRYDIQYKSIKPRSDGRVEVECFLTGAFELQGETGERYRKISDFHRFLLEPSKVGGSSKWKFVSGM